MIDRIDGDRSWTEEVGCVTLSAVSVASQEKAMRLRHVGWVVKFSQIAPEWVQTSGA